MTSCTGSVWRILRIWRKLVECRTGHRMRRVDYRLLAEALGRCRKRWGGGRWKSQNRKIVPLSPYVKKPLNSKVIKSFVPELRSHKRFSCFEIPMFYVYIWTSHVPFTYSCIWLWYTSIFCCTFTFSYVAASVFECQSHIQMAEGEFRLKRAGLMLFKNIFKHWTHKGTITPGQSRPWSNGSERGG